MFIMIVPQSAPLINVVKWSAEFKRGLGLKVGEDRRCWETCAK